MTASTSRADRTRYSSPLYLTSVPPYLLYSTLSPTLTSSGTRAPSSNRPGPTARTVPSWGFSLAVSGMTRPEAVVVSASLAWTTMRSSSGLMATLVRVPDVTVPPGRAVGGGRGFPAVAGAREVRLAASTLALRVPAAQLGSAGEDENDVRRVEHQQRNGARPAQCPAPGEQQQRHRQ